MNIEPPPQAAPGPAPDPAPDLAACVGAIRTSIVEWSATHPVLGRALDPVTAQILVLLQLLSTLLARFAAGDLPLPAAPHPATHRAPSPACTPFAASPAGTQLNAPQPARERAPPHASAAPLQPPPAPRHRFPARSCRTAAIPRPLPLGPSHPLAPARALFVRTRFPRSKIPLSVKSTTALN